MIFFLHSLNKISFIFFNLIFIQFQIGDLVTIEGSGAYCSGMSTKNYNSFPEVPEVILAITGDAHVIRK